MRAEMLIKAPGYDKLEERFKLTLRLTPDDYPGHYYNRAEIAGYLNFDGYYKGIHFLKKSDFQAWELQPTEIELLEQDLTFLAEIVKLLNNREKWEVVKGEMKGAVE